MNYHNITHDDMLNGEGLRVVLWVSGCEHNCKNCQNPQTHEPCSGIPFDEDAMIEIFSELDKDYINGITLSGGDPLNSKNLSDVYSLIKSIRKRYNQKKSIWLYSGYTMEEIVKNNYKERLEIIEECDVFVDGRYVEELKDNNYKWAGSTNQNVLKRGEDYEIK